MTGENGDFLLMPAQGYYKDSNERINYRPLWVEGYSSETKLF